MCIKIWLNNAVFRSTLAFKESKWQESISPNIDMHMHNGLHKQSQTRMREVTFYHQSLSSGLTAKIAWSVSFSENNFKHCVRKYIKEPTLSFPV